MRVIMLFTAFLLSFQGLPSDMIEQRYTNDSRLNPTVDRFDPLSEAKAKNKALKETHLECLLKFDERAPTNRSRFDLDFLEDAPTLDDILRENAQLEKKIETLKTALLRGTSSKKDARQGYSRFEADW